MKLIQQNNPQLCESIRSFGCRFRCLQAIAEIEEKKGLTIAEILESYLELSKDKDIMNLNCLCGVQEHLITNMAFRILGTIKKNCRQIGTMQDNVPRGWNGKTTKFQYMILHWKTNTDDGHYTLANKDGKELFDPWDNNIENICKIEIKRKLLYKIWRTK